MAATTTPPSSPRRIWLFSTPRTTSNLMMKIFGTHPALSIKDYPFMFTHMGGKDSISVPFANPDPETAATFEKAFGENTFDKSWKALLEFIETSEKEGKIPMIKDHTMILANPQLDPERASMTPPKFEFSSPEPSNPLPPPNPTYLPTAFLLQLTPLFIIRHPARMVPSLARASAALGMHPTDSHFRTSCSFKWSRLIFDFYRAYYYGETGNGPWPALVDGDDLINDTPRVVTKLCEMLEIDPSAVKLEWEKANTTGQPKFLGAFLGSLQKSTGVVKDNKTMKAISIDEESEAWKTEFGEEYGKIMADLAKGMMEDYEYLKKFSV